MKIAIVTYYAVTNIGDRILTDVLCWLLKGNDIHVVDLNGRYVYRFNGLLGKIERKIASCFFTRGNTEEIKSYFVRKLKNMDLIIFGGGQVADMKYTECSRNILSIMTIAEQFNIPVAFHAIGLGGSDYFCENAQRLKKAFSSEKNISLTVRERKYDVEKYLLSNSNIKVKLIADTAVWAKECYGVTYMGGYPYKKVGINVIRANIYNGVLPENINIIEIYCQVYQYLTSQGYEVLFFTNGVATDYDTLNEVVRRLKLDVKKIIKPLSNSGKHFLEMLGKFDFIISSRLHTSICCFSMGIPTIALPWDEKFEEFYRNSGQSERCISFSKGLCVQEILNKLGQALTQKYNVNNFNAYRNTVLQSLLFVKRI